jgi:hypothetical protein
MCSNGVGPERHDVDRMRITTRPTAGSFSLSGRSRKLLHDFAYVDLPAISVSQRILDQGNRWLSPIALQAAESAEEMRLRIGPIATPLLRRCVWVELGDAIKLGDTVIVPLTWQATGIPAVFPTMSADLEIAPAGPSRTQLTLLGRYDLPLDGLGRGIDARLFQRLAEATVRSFLRRICAGLLEAA